MSPEVTITVNGKALTVDASKMLIEELIKNGISVPHFCYHEALGVEGNCRMCMVEIKEQKRPQIACNTPIKEGMEISTSSDMIMGVKRSILELELINHPVDCPICDQAGECSLQEYYMEVGLHQSRIDVAHKVKKQKHVDLGGNVILDQERCVLCARCTKFTANVTQTHELVIAHRGNHSCVTTFADTPLEAKGYAMNVVDLCPVGALTSKDFRFAQRVWFLKTDASICHGCSTGCNIYIDHNGPKYEDEKIYRFRPRANSAVNGHFICDYGRLSYKAFNEKRFFNTDIGNNNTLKLIQKRLFEDDLPLFALLSASLSLEELICIKLFCERYQIAIYAGETSTLEGSFEDDMLKSSDKSSNRNALGLLELNQESLALHQIKQKSLILNFNNPDYINEADNERYSWIHFSPHTLENNCINLPMPSYSEKEGSLINKDFHLQRFGSSIRHPLPAPTIQESLAFLANDEDLKNRAFLWEALRKQSSSLKDIFFDKISGEGIKIEVRP